MFHPHRPISLDSDIRRSGDSPCCCCRWSSGCGGGASPAPVSLRQRTAALVTHRPSLLLVDGLAIKPKNLLQRETVRRCFLRWIHLIPVSRCSSIRQPSLVPASPLGHPFIISAQEARWREQVQVERTWRHWCFPPTPQQQQPAPHRGMFPRLPCSAFGTTRHGMVCLRGSCGLIAAFALCVFTSQSSKPGSVLHHMIPSVAHTHDSLARMRVHVRSRTEYLCFYFRTFERQIVKRTEVPSLLSFFLKFRVDHIQFKCSTELKNSGYIPKPLHLPHCLK